MKLKIGKLWICTIFCSLTSIAPSTAEIVPDATLPVNTTVIVNDSNNFIQGGTRSGDNLFHSFREFSLLTGETAFFNNSTDIQNIFSRVTGGSISNIDGAIKANGTANLFLLNPSGIIFCPNASLNIGGSFVATTANAVQFGNGTEFGVNVSQNTPLLIVSVPIGLQFNSNPGSIVVQGLGHNFSVDRNNSQIIRIDSPLGLTVQPGRTLALVGGEVRLNGGTLQAPAGRIEVAGVIGKETVRINSDGSLSLPATNRSDIYFADRARIDVRKENGGSIGIHGRNLEISGGSILSAGIAENLGMTGNRAGNIEIDATERVAISGASPTGFFSVISNQVGTKGTGNGGNINIQVWSLSVTNGATLNTSSFGNGNAGNIMIQSRDRVVFAGQRPFNEVNTDKFSSGAFARSETGAVGNSGSINIVTESLNVSNGGVVTNSLLGTGNAGNLTIQARDAVVVDGEGDNFFSTGVFSRIRGGAMGQQGSINIATRSLFVSNGALISTSTNGEGNGGSILINSTDSVTISGFGVDNFSSGLFTQTEPGAFGPGGKITVNTNTLRVLNGAVINAETVRDTNGGSIAINARTFEATNGGQVFTTTRGRGNAGDITINATDSIELSRSDRTFSDRIKSGRDYVPNQGAASGIYANTSETSTGAGGNLNVRTGRLIVRNGAEITVSADGQGAAGNLRIAADSIRLDSGAIKATTQAGNFGNIILQTGNLQLRRYSQITTNASGTATGGNINIEAGAVAALENSDIRANAIRGRGGNIVINAEGIFRSFDSDIDASSELGIDGNVELRTPDTDPVKGLNQPETPGVPPQPTRGCQSSGQRASRFVITGRGGLPPSPSDRVSSSGEDNFDAAEPLVEAQGWIINAKGEVELIANSAVVVPYSPGAVPPICN